MTISGQNMILERRDCNWLLLLLTRKPVSPVTIAILTDTSFMFWTKLLTAGPAAYEIILMKFN